MMNQVILVGRITSDVNDNNLTIAVNRSFKNADGVYETDFINIELFGAIGQNMAEYCKKGDIVGVKGRLQTKNNEDEDGRLITYVVAEKVTFLSSRKNEEEEEK